jgi:hypothetical protein
VRPVAVTHVKAKKKCCGSRPRCKRCAAVMKRMEKRGHAERTGKRTYTILEPFPKKALKAARKR